MQRIILATAWLVAVGCGGETVTRPDTIPTTALADIPAAEWERLAQRRLFFGHQSVGGNLMEGVAEVLKANPSIPLRIVESGDPAEMAAPALYHAAVGENGAPASKLAAFDRIVSAGLVGAGAAMLKYCYVDITGDTDPDALFAEYQRGVEALKARTPGLVIVHMTLPLQTDPGTLMHWRTIIRGKNTPWRELNWIRARYNARMRETYAGKEPLFDIATLEAIAPDGSFTAVRYKGESVPALAAGNTYDGGHLNEVGRRRLAEAFLVTLAQLPPPAPVG
jgi:hypothetical protein